MTVRLLAFIKRVPNMSFEEFDSHWGTYHGALFASLTSVKQGIVVYKQMHSVPSLTDTLRNAGLPVAPYDGVAQFEAEKLADILDLFASEEYRVKVLPDEAMFFDRTAVQVIAGTETTEFK